MKETSHTTEHSETPRRKKHWKTLKLGDQPLRKPVKHLKHKIPLGLN